MRWPTRDGRTGYGIHIRPSGGRTSKSAVISSSTRISSRRRATDRPAAALRRGGARRLRDHRGRRDVRHSVVAAVRLRRSPRICRIASSFARQAFEMGRSLTGYEVCERAQSRRRADAGAACHGGGFRRRRTGGTLCGGARFSHRDHRRLRFPLVRSKRCMINRSIAIVGLPRRVWRCGIGDHDRRPAADRRPCEGLCVSLADARRAVCAPWRRRACPHCPRMDDAAAELQRADTLVAPLGKFGLAFLLSRSHGDVTSHRSRLRRSSN